MPFKFTHPVPPCEGDDCLCDPVGTVEIGERLGMLPRSVHQARHRGSLPEPDFYVSGMHAWHWRTILWWAGETGRLTTADLRDEFFEEFGMESEIIFVGRKGRS